jgi:hypothetical protein
MMKDTQSYSRSSKNEVILSDNKILLSVSFAFCGAPLQTLKSNLEIVNVILNIPITNDGEQQR